MEYRRITQHHSTKIRVLTSSMRSGRIIEERRYARLCLHAHIHPEDLRAPAVVKEKNKCSPSYRA